MAEMEEGPYTAIRATKAYKVFISELARHLEAARPWFHEGHVPEMGKMRELAASFHTIKGSAGFFGFSDVGCVAGRLEDILTVAAQGSNANFTAIYALFLELEEAARVVLAPE